MILSVVCLLIHKRNILHKKNIVFSYCAIMAIVVLFGIVSFLTSTDIYKMSILFVYAFSLFYLMGLGKIPNVVGSVYAAALGSLIPLLMAPGVPWRSCLPFMFLSIIPIMYSFMSVRKIIPVWITCVFFITVACVTINNTLKIYHGYHKNYETNKMNDYQLQLASYKIRNKFDDIQRVTLFKLPAPRFAETMPYDRPLIEKWIKKYYVLPENVIFDWR